MLIWDAEKMGIHIGHSACSMKMTSPLQASMMIVIMIYMIQQLVEQLRCIWQGLIYGLLIGVVFMISPVVKSLGIGLFGVEFKNGYQFAITVTIAHAAFGVGLSTLLSRWNKGIPTILVRLRNKIRPE